MKPKKENAIKILFQFVGEEKGKMTLSVILAILGELFGMLPFLAAAMLANEVYAKTASLSKAIFWSGLAILGVVLRTVLCATSSKRSHRIAFTILKNIRRAIADKMKRVPMGVMLETPSGAFKTLMVDNVGKLEDSVAHMIPEAPSQIAAPFCCILLIFILDWRMGLVPLVTIPLGIPFIMGMMRGYSEKMELYLRSGKEMNDSLVEYVGGIQVIKAFGRSGESYGKFSDSVHFFYNSTLAWWKQCWFWMAAVKAIIPSTMLGTLPAGAWLYMNGEVSLPVYISCIIIPLGFIAPLMKLAFGSEQLTTIMANLQPIREFLAIKEQSRPSEKAALKDTSYSFENVSFSYNASKEVLHNISFSTAPGTMTAIVGPSGSGKSTIAKLMAGFWDADSGVVKYGSENIKNIPFEQLMGEISYVAQDNFLFDMSIRENMRMGNPLASNEEIEQAAKAANCHEFILKLEHGYDTLAGDAGDRLSGGERQRITIARAMLKKSNVVILDEATAYADPESEALIQEAVGRLVSGKTLIVVAHRLSTIQNADQILVVDHGAIIARGTPKEPVERLRPFRKLILFNSHCHPDHVGNNNIIKKIDANEKEHYISKVGITGLDATKDFYRKFKNIEQYYDYLNGPSKFPATMIRILKLTRMISADTPMYILVKNTLKKFLPLETSLETITPFERKVLIDMKISGTEWKGWNFNNQVFVMQAQGHSPDEVVFFLPEIKTLFLADETFAFFNCWPDSDSDKVKAVLNKSIQLFKSKEAEILISGHTHTVMKNDEAISFLETLLKDYAEFTKQVLLAAKSNPLGLTIIQIYKKLKSKRDNPAIGKFLDIEFPKMPPFLKTVITSILLENGFQTEGKYRKKRFKSNIL